ncbi:hypothetical protein ISF_02270 [Cordyceps fumosorosea ARSEF 2679]|uniref:Uncharacterized protein n=1 Tax=Cordyceps fumosorosea (strain ARSEF 2679) TaxID=1081104 RepID=A0A168BM21_CORFA|nr:hypothetical protein ISF_02270 [Cordyceps fumosorosea ARSEF 2679]OAA70296.1 hypothetical protein ISF_02270 [Cordyceps fumosorosea ARSEF 2679]
MRFSILFLASLVGMAAAQCASTGGVCRDTGCRMHGGRCVSGPGLCYCGYGHAFDEEQE